MKEKYMALVIGCDLELCYPPIIIDKKIFDTHEECLSLIEYKEKNKENNYKIIYEIRKVYMS